MSSPLVPASTSTLDKIGMTCFVIAFIFAAVAVLSALIAFLWWNRVMLPLLGRAALGVVVFGGLACLCSWVDFWLERRRRGRQ